MRWLKCGKKCTAYHKRESSPTPNSSPSSTNMGMTNVGTPMVSSATAHANITFTLVVDDFGIKYTSIANFHHLRAAAEELYTVTTNMMGALYCGLTLD